MIGGLPCRRALPGSGHRRIDRRIGTDRGRDEHDAAGHPPRRARAPVRPHPAAAAAGPRAARGRQRRPHERHPDARQPRLDRAGGDDGRRPERRAQLHRRRHVPLRDPRLHRRPAGPAAEAARPAGDGLAHGVPPLPRRRPQDRPRVGRPAAPRPHLAPPRAGGAAGPRRRALAGVGAHDRRPRLPARALRPVRTAPVGRPGAARQHADRPGRPGGGVGAAPAARGPPHPAQPAREHRPAGLRRHRGLRPRGAGALDGPGAGLLGDGVPLPEPPDRRGALQRAEPRPLGLGQVAAARPERPAERRRRTDPDGHHVAGRPRRRSCRPT